MPFDWIEVPSGDALIGTASTPAYLAESPATLFTLPAFLIARNPVTNAQYAVFVQATGHRPPAHWKGWAPPAELGNHPVTHIDWHEAWAFCEWAGVRLPTEAEWEKAARGSDGRRYPWGSGRPTPREANCGVWFGGTTEVGAFPAGASPYGVLDLSGNVWEWTASLDRAYPYRADDGREERAAAGCRILRGGSFNHLPAAVRCAARSPLHADACDEYIGFRVAVDGTGPQPVMAFDWVVVPSGPFRMGTEETGPATTREEWETRVPPPGLGSPRHTVEVAAFLIARNPVTNEQYASYVAATGARPPGHWEATSPREELRDHPVTYVDWHEATSFCAWAGVRLPTEVEWEKSAAGPDGWTYPWGPEAPDPSRAWFAHPAEWTGTRPMSGRRAGASPYGALDLAGNVWEWTSSLYHPYPFRSDDGREDPADPGQRVLRGGSFRSPEAVYLRCAFRSRSYPTRRRDHIGFRVVRSLPHDRPLRNPG